MQNYSQISSKDFKEKLNSGDFTLVDVRTAQEQLIFGIISETQVHIDVYKPDAIENIKKLPKTGKYLIYCYHGNRSQYVVQVMQELGFSEVYDLEGGIDTWNKN